MGEKIQRKRRRGFFFVSKQRQPRVLTIEIITKIEHYLSIGNELEYICDLLDLKLDTVRKAIKQGRLTVPDTTDKNPAKSLTKSERNLIDDEQQIGKACSNVAERILTLKTGVNCELKFSNQSDLQHAGVLITLPALLSQGLLKYR